jgi:hypothetical protein
MRRLAFVVVAALLGLVVGGAATAAWQERDGDAASGASVIDPTPTPAAAAPEPSVAPPTEVAAPAPEVLLAWTAGGLPSGFGAAVERLEPVADATVVQGGTLDLARSLGPEGVVVDQAPPGMAYPLDAIAISPATYPAVVPEADQQAFRSLLPGQALLGSTSAELRGLEPGSTLELLDGTRLTVAAVVDDSLVGAAEVVVRVGSGAAESAGLGIGTERYVLFTLASDSRPAVEEAVRSLAPGVPMRVRAPGETPYLRSSDAVLPQVLIKEVFGEFAYTPPSAGTRDFPQDPAWVDEHLVVEDLPVLGTIRCHRSLVPALRGAMEELEASGLGGLVGSFDGCWNARLVSPGGSISRHAFGAAVDLNFSRNPTGASSAQDDRLVEVMERWGFVSGDDWLVPDPGHFEYLGPPR